MSRSRKKTPLFGRADAPSDHAFKQRGSQARRARFRTTWESRGGDEEGDLDLVQFDPRPFVASNRRDSRKGNKQYLPARPSCERRRPHLAK